MIKQYIYTRPGVEVRVMTDGTDIVDALKEAIIAPSEKTNYYHIEQTGTNEKVEGE